MVKKVFKLVALEPCVKSRLDALKVHKRESYSDVIQKLLDNPKCWCSECVRIRVKAYGKRSGG